MGFDFCFRSLNNEKELNKLVDFLIKQDLGYPKYKDWVERAKFEIDSSTKIPILAYSNGYLVGDLIYQKHKEIPRIREVKNLRIHPDLKHRGFGYFMLKQAEENKEEYDIILCDMRSDQKDIVSLFLFSGYKPFASKALYDPNVLDIIMIKAFNHDAVKRLKLQEYFIK